VHSLRGKPYVIDIRNLGMVAGIELESRPGAIGARAMDCHVDCFRHGLLVRTTADIIALSPPLIIERSHIDQLVDMLGKSLQRLA
jgi:beta-alanine--pyruvate transaminase